MDARKLILTNGFTLRELFRLKTQYLSKKRIVYGREQKVTEDESFEFFILLIADLISSGIFIFYGIFFFMFFGHILDKGFDGGWIITFSFAGLVWYGLLKRKKQSGLNVLTILKMIFLRLRMRWYSISPPQVMDD
ncbi:hypothetical protein AAFN90_17860 [Erwiniaceae bacterium CAU 1747]